MAKATAQTKKEIAPVVKSKHPLEGIKYSRPIRTGSNDLPIYPIVAYSINRGGTMVRTSINARQLVENPITSLKQNPKWAGVRFDVTDEQMEIILATPYRELQKIEKQLKSK